MNHETMLETLAKELSLPLRGVEAAVKLLDDGNTVPFIARYRKEATGSLDDTQLRALLDRLTYLRNLEARREEVRALIEGQGALSPEVERALAAAATLTEIDDIYRPFRPKRKTRASVAKERGLEPLAHLILEQRKTYDPPIEEAAEAFVNEELGVPTVTDALAGASDIIAESVSDNAEYRKKIRAAVLREGSLRSRKAKEEDSVYAMYYEYEEKLSKVPSHRVLAINRGEKEEFLKVSLVYDEAVLAGALLGEVIREAQSPAHPYLTAAVSDSLSRLILPSVEREIRADLTDRAGEGAIHLFSENLKNLLMQPPLKNKTVLGYDPGYRTGCKLAVVDATGKVLDTAVIYPTKPREDIEGSRRTVLSLIRKHGIDVVAIGNGTASKESEIFIANTLKDADRDVKYIIVSESGASVYSASKLAAEEFPDFDVTQRSAVSIARRLQDPLAELVKIDPKSIGVGQYQHDMKQARLGEALDGVVEDCVNSVGVDVNTASHSLLSYIAGINETSAKNIVKYREEHGEFTSRAQLLKVPRVGEKAFRQCAGFLRVPESADLLDNTGVHPESYDAARKLLALFGDADLKTLRKSAERYGIAKLCAELAIGEPTLLDMIGELEKPGRDIRDSLPQPVLRDDVMSLSDLKEGMVLTGTVRNVIDFGAFVDIGVHEDGLVHISELSDKFVRHPSEVVRIGDVVTVRVKSVDVAKKRIGLSMKSLPKQG